MNVEFDPPGLEPNGYLRIGCPLSDTYSVNASGWRRGIAVSDVADLRVLIVEDQALLAMELEMVLTECGCDVVGSAMDSAGALAIAERDRPNLALVDINLLDGMTGPDIARRLVRDYGSAVVFLTANPEQIPDGFAGALGAVSKPFDESTIRGVVAFARNFIRHGAMGEPPRRFSPAPWLAASPPGIAPR